MRREGASTRTGAVTGAPGLPFAMVARKACGCISRVSLVEHHADRVRLEREWSREGLVVRACHLDHAALSVCRVHGGDGGA